MASATRPASPDKLTLWFVELGGPSGGVEATYNPKQISIDKTVPWTAHPADKNDSASLEFTGGGARTMALELHFDTYETGESVYSRYIERLELGTVVMEGKTGEQRRPPTCLVTWASGFPKFVGVIESLAVNYTMFFRNGTPCRATATIKLKEPPKQTRDEALKAFSERTPRERKSAADKHEQQKKARQLDPRPRPAKPAESPKERARSSGWRCAADSGASASRRTSSAKASAESLMKPPKTTDLIRTKLADLLED